MDTGDTTVTTFALYERGVCRVCGIECDGRSTYCTEHKPQQKSATTPRADLPPISVKKPDAPSKPDTPKAQRARMLAKSIMDDLNPGMVQGFSLVCAPIPRENFYTTSKDGVLQITGLGAQVAFPEWQAKVLGRATAELEDSPIAQSVEMVAGPLLPIAYGIAAVAVLVMHGTKMLGLRTELLTAYQQQVAAEQADVQDNTAPSPNGASSAEKVQQTIEFPIAVA